MAAKKIVNKEGSVSYTMVLENIEDTLSQSPSVFYFDNLVIYPKDNGEEFVHIIRYIPTTHWNNNSRDFKEFSGTIVFYLPTGEEINTITLTGEGIYGGSAKSYRKAECALVLEEEVTICTQLSETNSDELYGDEKCTTTYTYKWECTMGGGDGDYQPSDPSPEEPDGLPRDGGTTAPTYPDPEIKDPCEQMDELETNNSFKTIMKDLQSKTGLKAETGYTLSIENGIYTYTSIQGEAGTGLIDFNISGTIDGLAHTHYQGLLSTFSGADIKAIYDLYQNNHIKNPKSFTASVVTAHGTSYSLKIESPTTFSSFASKNLTAANFNSFEVDYELHYNAYKLYGEVVGREMALLEVLENSGLKLFRGNSNFSTWQPIKLQNLNVINNDCN